MTAAERLVKVEPRSKRSLRIWLRLLGCATLIEQQVRTRLRDDFAITLPQFDVLAELDAAGEPQTMSALSRRLMVSNGNVTGVIDRLERADLVRRTPSAEDLLGGLEEAERLARLLDDTKHHLRARTTRSQEP